MDGNAPIPGLTLQEKPPCGLTSTLASEIPLTASQKKNKRRSLFAKAIRSYKWLIEIVSKKLSCKISNTVIERVEVPHNDFIKRPKSQKKVINWAQQVGEEEIVDFPPKGDNFPTPHETFPSGTDDPQYLLMRWGGVVSDGLNEEIWRLWEELKTSDYETAKEKRDLHCDPAPVIHAGVWSHYSKRPCLTRDSCSTDGQQALNNMLQVIAHYGAPAHCTPLAL
ncbi:hypothetical protein M422DRAFT_54785 [Sphaerobolus stellatus SS14]|uniref:Uncharacterized protein n=1 Tax=Sphaerobolus stellatus (strain SS14) TaxID=990650 RepID=A0A0C9US55_SPHS4|nr:hypothetical protein M422DRAFT_54785 [Sphaerobolus stellatus SS14]